MESNFTTIHYNPSTSWVQLQCEGNYSPVNLSQVVTLYKDDDYRLLSIYFMYGKDGYVQWIIPDHMDIELVYQELHMVMFGGVKKVIE